MNLLFKGISLALCFGLFSPACFAGGCDGFHELCEEFRQVTPLNEESAAQNGYKPVTKDKSDSEESEQLEKPSKESGDDLAKDKK